MDQVKEKGKHEILMNYKGYDIELLFGLITVYVKGDDVVFDSCEEAKAFIDSQTE